MDDVALEPSESRPRHMHEHPPFSPRYVMRLPLFVEGLFATVAILAVLAAARGGSVLLRIDEPIMEWVVDQRTGTWTDVFSGVSRLGDNRTVFPLAAVLFVLAWPRCRLLAVAVLFAALVRPGFEFLLKEAVDRMRPEMSPLAEFEGPSHPSGHPLAVVSVWGLLPPVMALVGASRRAWWTATAGVSVLVLLVAAARVYRGAHWPTDVVASVLWGVLFLLVVELLYERIHEPKRCPSLPGERRVRNVLHDHHVRR